ncbi:hypothetical protein KGF54_003049 [Candida jiufengensis]|uniref:uncharacterized protein n=1 Tax=Candida jiufengensis TaxID=497108 RepID=UPI002224E42A|nr:uncharacterized protein KGF54_003049 [Candida jiufengensis]KAI5953677.1 hypothetical protein KGF54_003049 [Candida jiufengensis]
MYSAEYLPRLGQLSIEVKNVTQESLQNIELQGDQTIILILKDQPSVTILLPVSISHVSVLKVSSVGDILKLTLKVSSDVQSNSQDNNKITQWSCKWLQQNTSKVNSNNVFWFDCFECSHEIINSLNHKFKDMPNEFWYELMDFWHCHKPENNQPTDKDYGILVPKDEQTIIIGSYYLLNLVNENIVLDQDLYSCKNCGSKIGQPFQNAIKLLKWRLNLKYSHDGKEYISEYNPVNFVIELINTKIQSSAIRKFKIKHDNKWIYLWIMSDGIDVTINDKVLNNCFKILYTEEVGAKEEVNYEELEISYTEIRDKFYKTLKQNTIQSKMPFGSIEFYISFIPT